jgi:hypothetical protein
VTRDDIRLVDFDRVLRTWQERVGDADDPELERPEIISPSYTLRGMVYGVRVPLSPVANWSRFVLPTYNAPASSNRRTGRRNYRQAALR